MATSGTEETVALILAAGKGTRMKADRPKVLFEIEGRPMIHHVLDAVERAGFSRTIAVIGYRHDLVREAVAGRNVETVLQAEQLGTGHAVMMAAPLLESATGVAAVLAGDVPLIRASTLEAMVARHREARAAVTVLTAVLPDASGYGRIVRDDAGRVTAIVEEKDCTGAQRRIHEINSSIYAFDIPFLLESLPRLSRANRQGEYYLTDTVGMAFEGGLPVEGLVVEDFRELSGVNTKGQLEEMAAVLRSRRDDA